MRTSSIHPANYIVNSTDEVASNENNQQSRRRNFTPTKRCMGFTFLISAVALIVAVAIAIPLTVTRRNEKNQVEPDPIQDSTSSVSTATSSVSSSISNGKSTPLTMDTMLSTISTISDIQSAVSMDTPIEWSDSTMIHITPPTDTKDQSTPPLTMDTMLSTISTISDTQSVVSMDTPIDWSDSTMIHITPPTDTKDTTTPSTLHTTTTTTTTAVSPMIFLNRIGDKIIGLYNTTAGARTGTFDGLYTVNTREVPKSVMDDSTESKYFNYGRKSDSINVMYKPGTGAGFVVIPAISNSSVACGLLFATANDRPNRDPITVTLEGSNASDITAVRLGTNWTLIYNGQTGIDAKTDPGRWVYGTQQNFSNTKRFASYRLLITSVRGGNADAVQYSEARIIGYV